MADGRHRAAQTRQPRELTIARALTAPLLLAAVVLLGLHALLHLGTLPLSAGFLLLLAAAWAWALLRLRARLAAGKGLQALYALSPADFEEWVAARYRELGYRVRLTGMGGDHGADLLAERPGEMMIVQCKRYRTKVVSESMLRDLYGAMHDFGAGAACLVTTGRLTRAAEAWVAGKPITVWDGSFLARCAYRQPPRLAAVPEPICPRCGAPLAPRRHPLTRQWLLGCTRYPRCRHTQPPA